MRLQFPIKVSVLLLGVITAAAQESIQYGSISGRVEDASGAIIQGAKVTSRNSDTNISSTLLTDKYGRFRFPYLSVGQYEIRVQRPGFAEAVRSVIVRAGSAFELPVELSVAFSESELTVTSHADLLETARTQVAGTVSQAEVRSLPLNGRNLLDLALLVPGSISHQHRQQSAFRGNLGGTWTRNFDRQPAEFLQQLYRGWTVEQR